MLWRHTCFGGPRRMLVRRDACVIVRKTRGLPMPHGDSAKRPAQVVELQQKLAAAEERARQLEAAQKQLKERLAQAEQGLEVRLEPCAIPLLWPLTSSTYACISSLCQPVSPIADYTQAQ